MDDLDVKFDTIAKTIQRIFRSNRSEAGFTSTRLAQSFISQFEDYCPTLAHNFSKKPSFLYSLEVIEFAIAGLGDALLTSLWEGKDVLGYSIHTIRKRSQSFGIRIAKHLCSKESELKGEMLLKVNPATREEYLRNTFGLSLGPISVLLAYSRTDNRGRKQIASDLHLTDNTVKSHVHTIMKKMNTKSINEAVNIVRKFHP